MLSAVHRRAPADDDAGFTLAEMVVGMTLAVAVGALVLNWLLGAMTTNTVTTDTSQANADARNVLQSWAQYVQLGASPTTQGSGTGRIAALSPTSISFYANLRNTQTCTITGSSAGACPSLSTTLVTLSLTGNSLVEKVGSASSTVDVSGGVSSGSCLFTAYAAGTLLGCSALTPAQLASATTLALAFTVTPVSGHARSFTTSAAFTTYSNTTGGATNAPLS